MTKIRRGFVTNSSSTAFVIVNKSDRPRTALDFVRENEHYIEEFVPWFRDTYKTEITRDDILRSAADHRFVFPPAGPDGNRFVEVHRITWIGTVFSVFVGFVTGRTCPDNDSLLFKWEERWISE